MQFRLLRRHNGEWVEVSLDETDNLRTMQLCARGVELQGFEVKIERQVDGEWMSLEDADAAEMQRIADKLL